MYQYLSEISSFFPTNIYSISKRLLLQQDTTTSAHNGSPPSVGNDEPHLQQQQHPQRYYVEPPPGRQNTHSVTPRIRILCGGSLNAEAT